MGRVKLDWFDIFSAIIMPISLLINRGTIHLD